MMRRDAISRARTNISENPDRLLAYGGLVLGFVLLLLMGTLGLYSQFGIPITLVATCLTYLLVRRRLLASSPQVEDGTAPTRTGSISAWASVCVTAIVAVAAALVIAASADALRRPLWIFLVLPMVAGLILMQEVFFLTKQFLGLQVAILAIAGVLTRVIVFPYSGGDAAIHLHNAGIVVGNHTVAAISDAYHDYPMYPGLLASLSLLTSANLDLVQRLFHVFVVLVCLFLVHSIPGVSPPGSRRLLAVLLLLGGKWFIYWNTLLYAMVASMVLFYLFIAVLFSHLDTPLQVRERLLLFLIGGSLPFFHPIVTVAAVILLLGLWVLRRVYPSGGRREAQSLLLRLATWIVAVTLTHWMFFSQFVFTRTVSEFVHAVFREAEPGGGIVSAIRSPGITLLDDANYYFLLLLAGLEILRQIRLRGRIVNLYLGILGVGFAAGTYALVAIDFTPVVPVRWFLVATTLLVVPAASAFTSLFLRGSRWQASLGVVVFVAYWFLGNANNQVAKDVSIYGGKTTHESDLSFSQYAGLTYIETLMAKRDVKVMADKWYRDYLQYSPRRNELLRWSDRLLDDTYDGVFLLRPGYLEGMYFGHDSMADFEVQFERERVRISQFYDSGDMQWLDHVGSKRPPP